MTTSYAPRECQRLLAKLIANHPAYAPPDLVQALRPHVPVTEPRPVPPPPLPQLTPTDRAIAAKYRPTLVPKHQPSIADIVDVVAWFYQIPPDDLYMQRRYIELTWPRQIVFYLARTLIINPHYHEPLSYPAIARRFGMDHTSVMHGVHRITDALANDEHLRDEVDVIRLHVQDACMGHANYNAKAMDFRDSRLFRYYRERNPRASYIGERRT